MPSPGHRQQPVTDAFVDAANVIDRGTDAHPWKIDLRKLLRYLCERFSASRVLSFGGLDDGNRTQGRLSRRLRKWGYEPRLNATESLTCSPRPTTEAPATAGPGPFFTARTAGMLTS